MITSPTASVFKMYQKQCVCFIVLFVLNYVKALDSGNLTVSFKDDDDRSSLVFVFDTTGSMYNDLRQLKESAEMILNTALEESNIIADFVFVPFHDPGVGPPTVTRHKSLFKSALNIVRVYGGGDCPEKSLSGINMALEVSRPKSFVYVFTDATASDHRLVGKVLDMVQRKQSQVVFVLTGHCNDLHKPSYQVYEQIAAASSGQVFNLNKTNVHKVLEMVRTSIRGRNVNLGSTILPAGYNHTQGIPVDSTVGEVTVSVSGTKPQIKVIDPKGKEITGPPKLITTLDLSEIMVVKVLQPEPGNWSITVGSERDYSVRVVGLSNLTFSHGFSVAPPATLKDTSHRPLKSAYNHMVISVSGTEADVSLDHAEILSLSGRTLYELPLKQLHIDNLYIADAFVPPDDFFYVAINGRVDNQEFRRVGATAVQAKLPDVPYLTVPRKVSARIHERVSLVCAVESLVPVSGGWARGDTRVQPPTDSLQSTSIEYVIEDMHEQDAGPYRCVARNAAGVASADTELQLEVEPLTVTMHPGNSTILFGESLTIQCEVLSEVAPQLMQISFKGTNHLDDDVLDVYITPNEDGLYKYNKTISHVTQEDSGVYTCVAVNKAGRVTNSINITVQTEPTVLILGPHTVKRQKYSDIQLVCHVENAFKVQWIAPNSSVVMETTVNATYDGMFDVKNITVGGNWTCVGMRGPYKASDTVLIDILIKPKVRIEGDKNITIVNGTSRDVSCTVEARPVPRIIWHRETENFLDHVITPLSNDMYRSVLTLNSSKERVNATYFCIGENSQGIAEDSVSINVRRKMRLIKGFTDKSVELYSQVELHCHIDSYPPPNITWYHNETELARTTNVQVSDDRTTAYLLMVDFDNLGFYRCEADNGYEKMQVDATLTVIGLEPPMLSKDPRKAIARKHTSTKLTCRILRGKPEPSVTWQYKNVSEVFHELPFGISLNSDGTELSIPTVEIHHSGFYRCIAENLLDKDYYDVKFVVQYPPQVLGPPNELAHQVGKIERRVGSQVQFSCEVIGIPPPLIVWTKEMRPVPYNSNVYLTDNNDLVIEKASIYDSGLYTCNAVSPLGSSHKNFNLFIYEPPSIVPLSSPELQVLEGDVVELPCQTRGTPLPNIQWAHEPTLPRRNHVEDGTIRFVANLTDFGNYTCFAENDYGNASISYFLYVWVPPTVLPLEASKTALIGTNVTLQCDAVGFPIPTISWKFREITLEGNTSNVRFNDVGNLFITNVGSEHEGNYACVAANEAGENVKMIRLNVHEPPKIIEQDATSYLATNFDKEVVIVCNATGKPKPYVAWNKDGHYLDNDSSFIVDYDGTLTIKLPSEDLSGLYTCVAKNSAGETNKTIPVEIYSVPTVQSEESHSKVALVEGTNATVECPIRASHKDVVKWYKDAKLVSFGVLNIPNVTRDNSSELACTVTNAAMSAFAKVTIDVQWPPMMNNSSGEKEVIKDEDVYFDCTTDAHPKAKIKWSFNDKPLVFEDKERLKLLNVHPSRAGRYRCVATNIHGTATKTYTLQVFVSPFISEFDYLEVQLREGSDATLECNAKGSPQPQVKWMFTNTNWHTDGTTVSSHNVSLSSAGVFRCIAINSAGSATLTYIVTIVVAAKIDELVLYNNGEAQIVDKRAEVKEGTHVRISCKALGEPVPKIQWIKNGNVFAENKYNVSSADLIIDDLETSNAGIYTCVVLNEGGMDERKLRVEVLEPPKIFHTLSEINSGNTIDLEILLGQYFTMHCHPEGNPMPEVYWFKDGLPLRFFDDTMVSTDFGEVIVSNKALYEQSGNYTCVARNSIGNKSLVYLVDVLVPPPTLKDSVKTITTRVGHTLNLTCPLEGSPAPVVTWLRQPYVELGDDNPRVTLLNDNVTLLINTTEVSDSGTYSCVMTNKVGTTEVSFDVTIAMAPYIVGNVGGNSTEYHVVPLMRSVLFKCEVRGYPTPNITWLKDTQPLPQGFAHTQRVGSASFVSVWRATIVVAGQYACVAGNVAGKALRTYHLAVRVPGKWSGWSSWSYCNATCGLGYQARDRVCQYIDADNRTYDKNTKSENVILDVSECKGSAVERRRCHMPPCEEGVSARWGPWGPWGPCSATCGAGTQARTRRCKSTVPCYGDNLQIRKCPSLSRCEWIPEKRTLEASKEETTEMDQYMPEEVYEMQPEVISARQYKSLDVEEVDSKPVTPPSTYFEVPVNSNLDFSEPGPCRPGFRHNRTYNSCDDIDECAFSYNQCHSTQLCVNTIGGYRCGCARGYTARGPAQRCLDINECEQEIDGCEWACVNVAGGYACACPRHMRLAPDRHRCIAPSEYRQPYVINELDTGDYLSAYVDLPTSKRSGRS